MTEDHEAAHARTRTILWCLLDTDPGMPLSDALGYLKVIEAELDIREAKRKATAEKKPRLKKGTGPGGITVTPPVGAGIHAAVEEMAKAMTAAKAMEGRKRKS